MNRLLSSLLAAGKTRDPLEAAERWALLDRSAETLFMVLKPAGT